MTYPGMETRTRTLSEVTEEACTSVSPCPASGGQQGTQGLPVIPSRSGLCDIL